MCWGVNWQSSCLVNRFTFRSRPRWGGAGKKKQKPMRGGVVYSTGNLRHAFVRYSSSRGSRPPLELQAGVPGSPGGPGQILPGLEKSS
jgi:hypothetical protein